MTRSNAREIVANLIYEMNFTRDSAEDVVEKTLEPVYYDTLGQESEAYAQKPSGQQAYIRDAVRGIREKQGELDGYLAKYAINWSVSRISKVARAILHDSPVYIFDEATSNIDVESENDIMEQILCLARSKTVILISHRLANVVSADRIYVMEDGRVTETGSHEALLEKKGTYAGLWQAQQDLENYGVSHEGGDRS